jgi:hypothetical protein
LDVLDGFDRQGEQRRSSLELALEKARYEVGRARRQYDLVDPANRLVAGELEARWNAALEQVAELEEQLSRSEGQAPRLTNEAQTRLLELGLDLPALWNDPAASPRLKKRVVRTVVEEIVIADDEERLNHQLIIHWKGGVHSKLRVPRNPCGKKPGDTSTTALGLIQELSKVCGDQAIAAVLNRLGYRTGAGKTWRVHSVQTVRSYHRLTNHRGTGQWLTIEQAALHLKVSHTVIRRLIHEGTLPATQLVATTPWIIDNCSLSLPAVEAEVAAVREGRQLPPNNPLQAELPL